MKQLIIIGGATASGKTNLAIQLATYFQTNILSCDSRQCYKELSIGVAKPSIEELNQIPHFFINSHSIHQEVNVGIFEQYALQALDTIFQKNDYAIAVGGTGLYIKALQQGIDAMPPIDAKLKEEIEKKYETIGLQWLQETLQQNDPLAFDSIDIHNPHRMLRALIFFLTHKQSIITFQKKSFKQRPFKTTLFTIAIERETLYGRINNRVEHMMQLGLLEEAKDLYAYKNIKALQTVGYTELFDYLDKKYTLAEAIEKIKQHTRQYAKRQNTWFAHQTQSIQIKEYNEILSFLKT
ncbi:MAG: tRNA (adenosine(37)-N6)-dimethylallyltransferase MiaA [Chitinophagaceae bacterium]